MSSTAPEQLSTLFRRELELCRVGAQQVVGIYSESGHLSDYAAAFAEAAGQLDAVPISVDLPLVPTRGPDEIGARPDGAGMATCPPALRALEGCDLVVDLSMMLFTPELDHLKAAGVRVLTCNNPPDQLARLFVDERIKQLVQTSEAMLDGAATMRVTNDAGTDVTFRFGQFRAFSQYGIADQPGRWDNFASALAVNQPSAGGANGTLVIAPGDVVFPWQRFVADEIRMVIADGRIRSIEGGSDAAELERFLAGFDDERAYEMGHVGWGLHPDALWDPSSEMDPRSFGGSVMISTGPNVEFGGDNDTLAHVDIPMQACSAWIDDHPVIDRGRFVDPRLAG